MSTEIDSNTLVSHTDAQGRTLSGMGADVEKLAETMERHAPEPKEPIAAPADGTANPAEATPPVSRGRQRFSDLTKERDDARGETAKERDARLAAERERDELRQRLDATTRREPERPAEPEKPTERQPTRPEPTEEEIGTKYKTYAEFARDLAKWVVEQERAAATPPDLGPLIAAELDRRDQRQQAQAAYMASVDRGKKAYADFEQLLGGPVGAIPMARDEDEAKLRARFIWSQPQSEHIAHAILKDQALAERLRDSDSVTFGSLIAGLVPKEQPKAPAWTPPPQPHPTVGASSPTTPTPSSELAKKGFDFDSSGYREKRAAERGVKTRRW